MPEFDHDFVGKVLAGDRRSIAQAISAVENRDPMAAPLLRELFPHAGRAYIIGLTGSPGAGKSTLVEKLAAVYRRNGNKVAILAIDPTSPYSGGAILGDRVRMQNLAEDPGVYIRSMATRGQMGGLAPTTHDAVTVLDAAGNEIILLETVGVGQDEVEVARLADATVLLLAPGSGDDIQTFKAGVMEIADLYVVNKADRPGADRVEQEIAAMLSLGSRSDGWHPPILQTVATAGLGIDKLVNALDEFRAFGAAGDAQGLRRKAHWRSRVIDLVRQSLLERVIAPAIDSEWLSEQIAGLLAHQMDPYKVADEILAGLIPSDAKLGKVLGPVAGVRKIHHVGIAVESLKVSVPIFQKLIGHAPAPEEFVADQKVRVASFQLGGARVELLEGTSPDSPIAKFIDKRGQGVHHIALSVGDLRVTLKRLESDGVRLIDRVPREGADNELIAFLHPSSTGGILIELVKEP
jgi:LAO/AO transport system kinase